MLTVPNELALTESRTMRAATMDRTDVLDKVKALTMLPDGLHVTTEIAADYYEVTIDVVKKVVERNRLELTENGYSVLRGQHLRDFESDNPSLSKRRAIALFSKRTMLNLGELITGSEVAKAVRTRLLDSEDERAKPAVGLEEQLALALQLIKAKDQINALTVSHADLAQRVADLEPKAEGYDDLIAAEGCFDMSAVAKILSPVTGNIGRTRLLNLLRGMGIILQGSTLPEQKYIERGYFQVRTDIVNGKAVASTVATPKGLRWLQFELREERPTLSRASQPNVLQLPQQRDRDELDGGVG